MLMFFVNRVVYMYTLTIAYHIGAVAHLYRYWYPINSALYWDDFELIEYLIKNGARMNECISNRHDSEPNVFSVHRESAIYQLLDNKKISQEKRSELLKLILITQSNNNSDDDCTIDMNIIHSINTKSIKKSDRLHNQEQSYDRYFRVYCFETLLHIAIKQYNIEMIKLLMIYGVNVNMPKIVTNQFSNLKNYFNGSIKIDDIDDINDINDEQAPLIKVSSKMPWNDKYLKMVYFDLLQQLKTSKNQSLIKSIDDEYKKYEQIKNIFTLLDDQDEQDEQKEQKEAVVVDKNNNIENKKKIKEKIKNILLKQKRYFPELLDYYPKIMKLKVETINQLLKSQYISMTNEIIDIIIEYFYDYGTFCQIDDEFNQNYNLLQLIMPKQKKGPIFFRKS